LPYSVGIDFGTSNTLAAVATADGVQVCDLDPVNLDPRLLPTLLYFSRYGWHRVGRAATHAYQQDPDGRFVRALKSALPDCSPNQEFRMFKERHTLSGLLRLVLAHIRSQLGTRFGTDPDRITLGRPVRFSPDPAIDRRAEEMLVAGAHEAGFSQVRFLSEPEAATRYHLSLGGIEPNATVLVFDFGGGTLDLCLARTGKRTGDRHQILATGGARIGGTLLDRLLFEGKLLHHLGQGRKWGRGLDLPNALFNRLVNPDANWRISEHEYTHEVRQLLHATTARGSSAGALGNLFRVVSERRGPDLFTAIETAKMALSEVETSEIRYSAPGLEIVEPLSRADLRALFREQLGEIRALIASTLAQGRRTSRDVDRVLLAGGSSALICTQELLRDLFGAERVPARQDLFTSIVCGLALHAAGG
jgi:hypothetical chaperone protein